MLDIKSAGTYLSLISTSLRLAEPHLETAVTPGDAEAKAKCARRGETSRLPDFQVLQAPFRWWWAPNDSPLSPRTTFPPVQPHHPPPSPPHPHPHPHITPPPPPPFSITPCASSQPVTVFQKWLFIQKCFITERHSPCKNVKVREEEARVEKFSSFSASVAVMLQITARKWLKNTGRGYQLETPRLLQWRPSGCFILQPEDWCFCTHV